MKTKTEKTNQEIRSEKQAEAQLESITEMVVALNDKLIEKAEQEIQEYALSVEVRSGWYTPGAEGKEIKPTEYKILLCCGGPAVRIIGDLTEHSEPETARLEHQDWGTPWTELHITSEQEEILLDYARCFYFGA